MFRFRRGQPYSEVNLANREAILESAGVHRNGEIWKNKIMTQDAQGDKLRRLVVFKCELAICSCHIRREDVMEGQRAGSFLLHDGAKAYTAAYLKGQADVEREHPFDRCPGNTPLAQRRKEELERTEALLFETNQRANELEILLLERMVNVEERVSEILDCLKSDSVSHPESIKNQVTYIKGHEHHSYSATFSNMRRAAINLA